MEQATVGQFGQGVKIGLPSDQFFGFLLFGDIGEKGHIAMHATVLFADSIDGDPLGVDFPVLSFIPYIILPMTDAIQCMPHFLIVGFVMAAGT